MLYASELRAGILSFALATILMGCATTHAKPCTGGGQPAHDAAVPRGIRRCYQVKDSTGKYVNEGKYLEWYPSEKIATVGEYSEGKKTGKWTEYDEKGNVTSIQFFKNGKEIEQP